MPRRRRRGYPVAVLIGLERNRATLWNIYSESIKPDTRISMETNPYNFYEAIIDRLRPNIKQGVKTILIAAPDEKNYEAFKEHIQRHQRWLIAGYELNRITLEYVEGSATHLETVVELIEAAGLRKKIQQASNTDIKRVMSVLEKRLGTPDGIDTLLFTLDEVEEAVYRGQVQPEYILITAEFQRSHGKRTQRLLQIAQNNGIKSMIVDNNSKMGSRLSQFGGLIAIMPRK